MKTGRSKLMLKLVEETSKNSKSTGFTHDERMDEEDCIPGTPECRSLLPPGARNVIEEMNDICEDVFLDDVHGTSEIIKSTNENMDPNIPSSTCVLEEDPFMAVYENASSSYLLASENQHGVVSLLNITSDLTPLNTSTLISDLSPFPQPITPTVDNNGHGQTPKPSPVKTHGEKADIAVASMTINYAREAVIDFTKPFMNLGIGILFKVPTSQPTRLFSFLNPLAIEIWLYVLAAYILVSFTLFVMARFSPYEWSSSTHGCGHETKLLTNQFNVCNSFWFITGTFLRQGSGLNPMATSTRIVGGIWWFFTLIILSSYTANLAAFLTVERTVLPIQSAADLAAQNHVQYGTLNGGSTMTFFRDSNIDIYQKMWQHMSTASPPALVSSYEEGVRRVLAGNYAFLMESTMLDHRVQRDCNLTQIGGLLDSKGYGIATWKGSPWRDKISLAILDLQEKGVIQILYDKWWKNTGDVCNRDGKDSKANPLGGVFVTLLCGLALAIVVAILEFCWNTRKNASHGRQSLCSEMGQELRAAIRGGSSRTVLRPGCSRCSPATHVPPAPSRYEMADPCTVELKELRWS
ncbi:unnamed protein product [Parnassius apollo]|uniref:(apollo) hypothetical protein n=1 Tax=Parnassius apollo TaxID=110799 RepID=A0A8S3WG97_PARAO|nr:unnamed protein product [Parnassius apollo]